MAWAVLLAFYGSPATEPLGLLGTAVLWLVGWFAAVGPISIAVRNSMTEGEAVGESYRSGRSGYGCGSLLSGRLVRPEDRRGEATLRPSMQIELGPLQWSPALQRGWDAVETDRMVARDQLQRCPALQQGEDWRRATSISRTTRFNGAPLSSGVGATSSRTSSKR